MKGTRPLSTDEIIAVSEQFDGTFEVRNRSLFMLGVSIGGRISELLALRISDVYQNGQPVSDLLFEKNMVKGKETARMIPVNEDGRQAISVLIAWHQNQFGNLDLRRHIFMSRQGGRSRSRIARCGETLSRSQPSEIIALFQRVLPVPPLLLAIEITIANSPVVCYAVMSV